MGLAHLLEMPETEEGWGQWFWHTRTDHDLIRSAVQEQGGPNLIQYVLEPVYQPDMERWLKDHWQTHVDFNEVIKFAPADLESVNLKDPEQRKIWLFTHYTEHQNAHQALQI